MRPGLPALAALLVAASAVAAPKIETIAVKPNPARFAGDRPPEVEIAVSVRRTRFDSGTCDVRLEFGDGQGRTLDFGLAATRTVRHVYRKGGSYTVVARGAGASPCEGSQQAALSVAGAPEPAKKAQPEKKNAQPKKKAARKADKKAEKK